VQESTDPQGRWEPGAIVGAASVVLVTSDMSVKVEFREYLTSLSTRLWTIVYEECHVYVTDTSYRKSLLLIRELPVFPCKRILLSTIAPPNLVDTVIRVLNILNVYTVWALCVNPEVALHVHKTVKVDEYEAKFKRVLIHCLAGTAQDKCILVSRRGRSKCEERAKEAVKTGALTANYYHPHCTMEHKKRVMEGVELKLFRYVFCTCAFGNGVDIHGVRHIVHLTTPDHLIEYTQQSGRCARDGRVSEVYLIYHHLPISVLPGEEVLGTLALREYMTGQMCLHVLFSKFFDGCGHVDREVDFLHTLLPF
jgi:superfamily II DNA helicase RecQ